ncbi:phage tail fiber protein [Proteus terrae]|uniref:phage tail fiber protein n=1 Tax=Proteus terrae TaxID=1574161 RepID=UPI001CC179B6|nr:hypothetical protein [Proteus terrae]
MIYTTGTVNTVSGSAIVRGTGTKFKNNNPAINIGMTILIKSGNTNIPYMIKSVNSDTELVLAQPALATATNTTFSIHITEPDNNSDAARTMVAINAYTQYFLDAMNTWMSETGQTKIEMPNGEVITLDSIKKMQGDISKKFDKAGGTISGDVIFSGDVTFSKNAIKSTKRTHTLPEKSGTLMQVGDYGWGDSGSVGDYTEAELIDKFKSNAPSQILGNNSNGSNVHYKYACIAYFRTYSVYTSISASPYGQGVKVIGGDNNNNFVYNLWTSRNATKDSNGNLKAASPIVKVFADYIETNDESEGAEMERLGVGHYLIKGVVGFNADGLWGINNGFVIPQDHNGKNMVLIDYEVRPDGDIEVFVFHQQNADMPERFQNKRIKHLDEDGNPVYYENYEPCDVPESRWIDMRVEMPLNSIYNQKQAEAERLAKEEAERQAEEEAKRAEIEAE